jgi:4-methoxybenzoate monooxygenase (O-demethylating)
LFSEYGCRAPHLVARLEGEAVLSALATRVASIKIMGEAVYRDRGLRALSSLPVRVVTK